MQILLIDNGTRYLKNLKTLLRDFKVRTVQWRSFNLSQAHGFDLVILSGGHLLPVRGHTKEYKQEIQLIRKFRGPLIGICLGFELIAQTFGAKLKLMQHQEKGIITIRAFHNDPLFHHLPPFKVYENHRWVVARLPKPLIPLAYSRDGIEAFRHATKPIYGFQFHPEMFTKKTYGDELFRNTVNSILGW